MSKRNKKYLLLIIILSILIFNIDLVDAKTKIQLYQPIDVFNYFKSLHFIPIIIIVVLLIVIATLGKKKVVKEENISAHSKLNIKIPEDFNYFEFHKEIFFIYNEIEKIYYSYNCDTIKELVTEELYKDYLSRVESLKKDNVKKICENLIMKKIDIKSIDDKSTHYNINTEITVLGKEFTFNTNNEKIEKYKNEYTEYIFEASFNKLKEEPNSKIGTTLSSVKVISEKNIPFKERNYLNENPKRDELYNYFSEFKNVLELYATKDETRIKGYIDSQLYDVLDKERKRVTSSGKTIILRNFDLVNAESLSNNESKYYSARLYVSSYDYITNNSQVITRGDNKKKLIVEYEVTYLKETKKLCDLKIISQKYN